MKRLIFLFALAALTAAASPVFTEFYCDASSANASNVWAGSTTGAPIYSTVNGNWDGTSVFTPTDGSTPASTVSAGMWCSVYTDGQTNLIQTGITGGRIAKVISVAAGVNGAITLSTTAFAGTAPSSSATGRTLRCGGVWKGPYGATGFATVGIPFNLIANTATNGAGQMPRVNFKNGTAYSVTAGLTHANAGPIWFEGYASTVGDGGKALISGPATGSAVILLNFNSANNIAFVNFEVATNGGSSSAASLLTTGSGWYFRNVSVHRGWGHGINSSLAFLESCEAYDCNRSDTSGLYGIFSANSVFINCSSHDNIGGIERSGLAGNGTFLNCSSWNNGGRGFAFVNGSMPTAYANCNSYSNLYAGLDIRTATAQNYISIFNCNFLRNGGLAITNTANQKVLGFISNCGFGTGTMTNGYGQMDAVTMSCLTTNRLIEYASDATPWNNPDAGDFTTVLSSAKAMGYAAWTFYGTNSPTISYPDIGAAQSSGTNSVSSAYSFAQ